MKIATWNVNSIKQRLGVLLEWLRASKPDIVLLQEIKCQDENFPALEIEDMGYNLAIFGQKSYNGVAILSIFPLEDVRRGLPGDPNDDHARYIEAVVSLPATARALRVASVYVPNGQEAGSDKFAYKLRFLERLYDHVRTLLPHEEMLAIGGDYNVAPKPEDVWDPQRLDGSVCYHPEERARLRRMLHLGMTDAFEMAAAPASPRFTFWDYRANAFAANKGYRIDHILLSPQAADRLVSCTIASGLRALDKASDHAPVEAVLRLDRL